MSIETEHRLVCGDARDLSSVADESVELVVTSPPYPMIEMWDDAFASMSSDVDRALTDGDGDQAFNAMHAELDTVWTEVERVLVDGGIACVNIGDATRTIADDFQLYPNHARIIDAFRDLGFRVIPDVLWRKPTNSMAKFMGSGTMPPNAYITLEHEYILVFRKGDLRSPDSAARRESAYFWEERNEWFTDVWADVNGAPQATASEEARDRSAAFPFDIPHRLINMYSVRGDTVLDPFVGTGTTTLAAMCAGRDSIGVDADAAILDEARTRIPGVEDLSTSVAHDRLQQHVSFVTESGRDPKYESTVYGFPVMTKAERDLQLWRVASLEETDAGFRAVHELAELPDSTTDETR